MHFDEKYSICVPVEESDGSSKILKEIRKRLEIEKRAGRIGKIIPFVPRQKKSADQE